MLIFAKDFSLNILVDPDDFLNSTTSDSAGFFNIYGETVELSTMDPYLIISHNCLEGKIEEVSSFVNKLVFLLFLCFFFRHFKAELASYDYFMSYCHLCVFFLKLTIATNCINIQMFLKVQFSEMYLQRIIHNSRKIYWQDL